MALQNILDAIIAEADERIATMRSNHQKRLSELREESERRLAKKKQEIAQSREEKKNQILLKTEAAVMTERKNSILQTKRRLLDRLYTDIESTLASRPEKDIEPLLKTCLQQIRTAGTIHPAAPHAALLKKLVTGDKLKIGEPADASGGFLFVSDKEEQDFTFPTLIQTVLRPRTEVDATRSLFQKA